MYSIGVKYSIRAYFVSQFCHLRDGHYRTHLIIDHHHRYQEGVLPQRGLKGIRTDASILIRLKVCDLEALRFQLLHTAEYSRMFNGGGDDVLARVAVLVQGGADGPVVAFAAAGGDTAVAIGAKGGIGGTYGAMPKLYLKIYELMEKGEVATATKIQNDCCRIIYKLCSAHGNMYAVIKEVMRRIYNVDCGSVRAPLSELIEADEPIVEEAAAMIREALAKYC